jgi:SAM-dependent MidA family methyltransferase
VLTDLLRAEIQKAGPLSLYDYMALCLYHPQRGYYMRQIPMGAEGDFITAPEISQMFGELVGAYLLQYAETHLKNTPINLVECGPGKGTLTKDILKVFQLRPALQKHVKLLEISPVLRAHQQQTLAGHAVEWYTDLEALLEDAAPHPLLLIANEFLDALPANQYTYVDNAWHQRHVTWENNAFAFCWKLCDKYPYDWPHDFQKTNDIYENTPDTPKVLKRITQYLKDHGGMAVFIDYGYVTGAGDTLQAMRNHQYVSVLENPGEVDLTTHVNFGALETLAKAQGCVATVMTQGMFLSQLGIQLRAQQLTQNSPSEVQTKVRHQLDHLTKKMGELFKVLVVQNPS